MKELLHRDGTPMRKYSSPLIDELNKETMNSNEIILEKLTRIEAKLDEVITALHEYDNDQLDWPEPNDALKEAAFQYNEKVLNERMDIIGQNGNEGSHYVTNEEADEDAFNDYGARVGKDKSNNIQPKQKQYYKNSRSKRNGDKKSAVVEHQKYPPHKH